MTDATVVPTGTSAQGEEPGTAQPKRDEPTRLIQLNIWGPEMRGWGESGLKHAIVEFLNGLAAGAYDDLPETKLVFGTSAWQLILKLRKHPDGAEYIAFGDPIGDKPPAVVQSIFVAMASGEKGPMVEQRGILHTSGAPMHLEYQLRRFAENRNFTMLIVSFPPGLGELYIWKKPGGYGIVNRGLPQTEALWNMHTGS